MLYHCLCNYFFISRYLLCAAFIIHTNHFVTFCEKVSTVGEKLQSTEETMKVQEAEWHKNIEEEKEKVSKMVRQILNKHLQAVADIMH